MTFLAPAAGIVAAAIALPLLVILYLLRLRRRPLRVSSTLLWEQAAQDLQVNVPLRMIRWSWLLLLHVMALCCFLVAIARPAVGTDGTVGKRVVIIVDRSASMNATDVEPAAAGAASRTRLDVAKARTVELIGSIGRSGAGTARPRCMVISMAATPQALTGFTTDLRALRDAVEAITPTDQPDDFPATLQLIDAMTAKGEAADDDVSTKPTVFLITDGVVEPPQSTQYRGLNPSVLLTGETPGGAQRAAFVDNVGIVAVSARHDPEDSGLLRVFARLVNAGPASVTTAVRCTVDGELLAGSVQSVNIPAASQDADEGTVTGEAAAVFAVRPPPATRPRTVVVSISRTDVLAADDAAGVVVPMPWRPRILIVAPDPVPPSENPEADVFLLQAMDATEPASIRVVTEASTRSAASVPGGATAPSPWAGVDVVVFDRTEPPPPPGTLPGVPTLSVGTGLRALGVEVEQVEADRGSTRALAWRREHPALRYVGLDTLVVAPASWLNLPASESTSGGATFSSLVDGAAGPLVAEVIERAPDGKRVRRLVVSFELSRSNWGPDVSFPLFIGNVVEYFSASGEGSDGGAVGHSTTSTINVSTPPGSRGIVATGPQRLEIPLPPQQDGAGGASGLGVAIGALDRVGVYTLRSTDGQPVSPATVVINLSSERESRLTPRLGTEATTPDGLAQFGSGGGPREVWHWFILAALVPLILEWFVYAWQMRG